ncbi:hypothetical protein GCM10027040_02320 [Halomonas shantousis]
MARQSLKILHEKGHSEFAEKVFLHLPTHGDSFNYILSSHLVIEEVLTALLYDKSKANKSINNAKLSFSQKVHVLQAFYGEEFEPSLYASLLKLNKMRNKCAHVLDPPNIDDLAKDLVSSAFDFSSELEAGLSQKVNRLKSGVKNKGMTSIEYISEIQNNSYTITDRIPWVVESMLCQLILKLPTNAS